MQELIANFPHYVEVLTQLLGAIVILATIIVRLTPSKTDDSMVSDFAEKVTKFCGYLPTLGLNPNTKKLKEAYEELKGKQNV